MYTLKKNIQGFTVIDGAMAGKSYKHGVAYLEIPPQEAAKFDKTEAAPAAAGGEAPATAKKREVK